MTDQNKQAAALKRQHLSIMKAGAGTLAVLAGFITAPAFAQSTASQLEEIIVTGKRGENVISGLITAEQAPKARSTVTQEYMLTQTDGQSVGQLVNLLPGVNFTSEDPYGNSGGNIRLRGFDGSRISLTWDGIPLNDTGNYATYFNQTMDAEVASRIAVNLGTTDVDSPTPSAIGGTVNIVTIVPSDEPGAMGKFAVGTDNYHRIFGMVETGSLGTASTKAFVAASYTKYDKFKGPGDISKKQFNARVYQPLSGTDFVSLAFHYNENRKDFYRRVTQRDIEQNGWNYDYTDVPFLANGQLNSNFYGVNINPSNTGNIRGQSQFTLTDSLLLTVDPYIQYTLANGGGTTLVAEQGSLTYPFVHANMDRTQYKGVDLDGDCSDAVSGPNGVRLIPNASTCGAESVRLYSPSNTNTWRPGVTTSVVWDVDDNNRLRFAYTLDYGRHRQTGELGYIDENGYPENVFSGRNGTPALNAGGEVMQKRDRKSIAMLNQFAVEYSGRFMEDALRLNIGARAPFFERELNNYCYSEAFNASCTYGDPAYVPFTPERGGAAPFTNRKVKYDDVLPNIGVAYRLFQDQMVYASFAQGFKLPSTDNLYNPLVDVDPETTDTFDIGYRYQGDLVTASIGGWYTMYKDRIESSWNDELQMSFDQNIGDVDAYGVDAEIGFEVIENLELYFSASYNKSEYQDDVDGNNVVFEVAGKRVVETPEWQFATRASYSIGDFSLGADAKYVGTRYSTYVNDESTPSYIVVGLDAHYDLDALLGTNGALLKVNVNNLFDEKYYGNINPQMTAANNVLYSVGARRSVTGSLTLRF